MNQASTAQFTERTAVLDATASSPSKYATPAFWEGLWRTAGIQFVAFFIITYIIYGYEPGVGSSAEALATFYVGGSTRILIAAALFGLNLLNPLWFASALV